jgi:uncharacterized protein (UPF0371 family)
MILKKGFDLEKYIKIQSEEIIKRVNSFDKLYLEFGGKLFGDFHASRVLPGYHPDTKIKILQMIKEKSEIIFCVSSKDIENTKIRGDSGMNYEKETLNAINNLKRFGLNVSGIVVNRFSGEKKTLKFKQHLDNLGIRVYLQKEIEGYPADIEKIVSEDGYGQNPYIKTEKQIVIVTGVGPGSGKMSFCLSQLYFDSLVKKTSCFAKFETFPVWDLPLEHPVNIAYEAATADIGDVNMIDSFHLKEYGITTINYNRDIENFPILKNILKKIGKDVYNSPTEMGVSKTKQGIINEEVVKEAAKQEVLRRYFRYKKEYFFGHVGKEVLDRIERIMQRLNLVKEDRRVVVSAREALKNSRESNKGNRGVYCGSAIQLNGKIITGKNSELLSSESACIINALKELANIPDNINLISSSLINSLKNLNKKLSTKICSGLDVSEILIALALSVSTNPSASECLNKLCCLKNTEMHTTHLPSEGDEIGIRNIGINLTADTEIKERVLNT